MIGRNRNAFSLLEVVLALAVFAIIVVPAIGLVALSYRNSETDLQAPNAVEIKSLLELELRGAETVDADDEDLTYRVFEAGFISSDVEFYASQDLGIIKQDGATMDVGDKYYKVTVTEPVGYVYSDSDAYRVFLFNVIWPAFVSGVDNEANAEGLQQLILPVVLSK
jgi:hypothetical protein